MKLTCYFFGHAWNGCECRRCKLRKGHDWQPWQPRDSSGCWQARVCGNCHTQETRLVHTFGEWVETSATARMHVCTRCRVEETQRFETCTDCQGSGVCSRCHGSCCDPYGRSCDLCCGTGDCRGCTAQDGNGWHGNWYS